MLNLDFSGFMPISCKDKLENILVFLSKTRFLVDLTVAVFSFSQNFYVFLTHKLNVCIALVYQWFLAPTPHFAYASLCLRLTAPTPHCAYASLRPCLTALTPHCASLCLRFTLAASHSAPTPHCASLCLRLTLRLRLTALHFACASLCAYTSQRLTLPAPHSAPTPH